jgi:hypothetical protein
VLRVHVAMIRSEHNDGALGETARWQAVRQALAR